MNEIIVVGDGMQFKIKASWEFLMEYPDVFEEEAMKSFDKLKAKNETT